MNTKLLRILSRVFFFLGIGMGLALSLIAIWNNVESTDYYFTGATYAPFDGLRCPLMIAPTEKGIVTVVFNNPASEEDEFYYQAEISGQSSATRQIENQIVVPAHASKSIQLTVDANDVDLLFFILVKLSILPNGMHPSQEAVCGILMVDLLGLTGAQISTTVLLLSLSGIAIGLILWQRTNSKTDREMPRIVQTLGLAVLLAMFATYMGWWAVAIVLTVIAILLMVIALRFAVT